jgi:protein-S-isoprenylcysteine O-methyltransferase Ste14
MHVVDTGPYALVRHPIYAGLFVTAAATVAIKGDLLTIAGFVVLVALYTAKARIEERFLLAQLGEPFAAYRARVAMLVPFLW